MGTTSLENTMNRYILSLLFILSGLTSFAQEGIVTGRIRDLLTENGIDSTAVTLLTTDSARVSAAYATCFLSETQIDGKSVWAENPKDGAQFRLKVPKPGKYILRCMVGGYRTAFFPITVNYSSSKSIVDVGDFYLQEISTQIAEAVVTGTKIRMFYKGDTLVYNASAFQLPDGSMLDDLVKQLPGAEIRDGNIYVNGRMVENLLLGGKDFFNGDPRAALANLPAYVINNVKVYEKRGDKSQTTGTSMGDEQYVMDVHLKRKYVGTYLGRLVAGYGTEDRYQAGLFLMRFDDRQSFNVMADFNNRNQNNQYSRNGAKNKSDASGKHRRNYVALNYQYEPNGKLRFTAGAAYNDNASHDDGGSSTENYLSGGNTFTRMSTASYTDNMSLSGNTRLTLRPSKGRFYELHYAANYTKSDGHSDVRTANYNAQPPSMDFQALIDSTFLLPSATAQLQSILQSRLQNASRFDGNSMSHNASATMHHAFGVNLLNVEANFTTNNRNSHNYNLYNLNYCGKTGYTDFRNRYQDAESKDFKYYAKASYDWIYRQTERSEGQLSPYYAFTHARNDNDSPLYRLDALGGDWADVSKAVLGSLPSTREELMRTLSSADSYWSNLRDYQNTMGLNWWHEMQLANERWLKLSATTEITLKKDRYDYFRYGENHHAELASWLPAPTFSITYNPKANDRRGMGSRLKFTLSSREEQVTLHHLIDITDASDPLYVQKGNPNLQNPWTHKANLELIHSFGKRKAYLFNQLTYTLHEHEVAMASTYDRTTGVRTTTPVNIDGNWNLRYYMMSNFAIDKDQRWFFMPMLTATYTRSADMNWTTDEDTSVESTVKTLNISGGTNIQFRPTKWLNLSGGVKAEWNYVTGSRAQFETIRATNMLYDLQARVSLPASFVFYAICNVTSRYGYNDSSLNDTRVDLNVSLEKTIKQFTLKLQGSDLFARNRYTTSIVNSQGRTETFATCIPRYVFLSLTWKFNKTAKKKNASKL